MWRLKKIILLGIIPFLIQSQFILKLIQKFDRFHEYIFLLALGWCLGMAEVAHFVGLSAEIGAFIAGISLATSPISQYIAVNLKPLRDFFLVLFFFSLGARFNLGLLGDILLPAVILATLILILKPIIYPATVLMKKMAWPIQKPMEERNQQVLSKTMA